MKKILLSAALAAVFVVVANAALLRLSRIGPASGGLSAQVNIITEASQQTAIGTATAGQRQCLSKMSFIGNSTSTIRILDGGTTVYTMDLAASTPIYELWGDDDMCGASGNIVYIKVSTASRQSTTSSQSLNYTGFFY